MVRDTHNNRLVARPSDQNFPRLIGHNADGHRSIIIQTEALFVTPAQAGSRACPGPDPGANVLSVTLDSSPDLIRGSRGNDDSTGRDRALVGFARQVEVRKDAVDVW